MHYTRGKLGTVHTEVKMELHGGFYRLNTGIGIRYIVEHKIRYTAKSFYKHPVRLMPTPLTRGISRCRAHFEFNYNTEE